MENIRNGNKKKKTIVLLVIILMIAIINICPIISNAVETGDTPTGETEGLVEIAFKDQVLYNKMLGQLNGKIESKTDATKTIKMTKENVESVTEIYLSKGNDSEKITDITGMEKFTKLTVLDLNSNQISNISVLKELTNLTELRLFDNQISDISALKELKNLTKLDLRKNQISDISALKELKNLTKLDLGKNQISDISALKELKNLTELDLGNNQISDITALKELKNLTNLNLNENQISDITALKELKNLTDLNLNANQISDISALEGILGKAKIRLIGNKKRVETIDDTHKVELPAIFEQAKELMAKGYGQYEFYYIGCTLNSDGKSVTIEEGTNIASALVQDRDSNNKIILGIEFEIIDNYKPVSSGDKNNTNTETGKKDPTEATGKLPFAGQNAIILLAIILTIIITVILKMKVNKYKGIK